MHSALHFGAGNIGRGFLGQLYSESGWHTTFVDVNPALVDALNKKKCYPLTLVGAHSETRNITPVSALNAADEDAIGAAFVRADLVSTAVGANILAKIAPVFALAIAQRATKRPEPINVILCENLLDAAAIFRAAIKLHLPQRFHAFLDDQVGLVEASVGRMVPVQQGEESRHPLEVRVEPYCTLPVDAEAFRGPIPAIQHMEPRENFKAYVARKLYVHNMSHAATAYLGALKGHTYIWEAIGDPEINGWVREAIEESAAALHRKFDLNLDELRAHGEDLLFRYTNQGLADQVERVARDPLRKLSPGDRFVGALNLCEEQGLPCGAIARAVGAALCYTNPSDPESMGLQEAICEIGVERLLLTHCLLQSGSGSMSAVLDAYAQLTAHP
ncbi:MAG: mannitol-1-phosphate 5-dehydrogenase [Candidatus Hydrogenedentes bacterium]|nr:mannitol-1-phosphate 5-dehydrogenase [Candidatus Hydrogenedentota bacterium]